MFINISTACLHHSPLGRISHVCESLTQEEARIAAERFAEAEAAAAEVCGLRATAVQVFVS